MEFEIVRSNRKTIAAEIRQNKLIIRAPLHATNEDINRFMLKNKRWFDDHLAKAQAREKAKEGIHRLTPEEVQALANRALEVIPERVAHYAPLVGVTYGRITIRNQRSRWGSCSSNGRVCGDSTELGGNKRAWQSNGIPELFLSGIQLC